MTYSLLKKTPEGLMKTRQQTQEQIISVLKEGEAGAKVVNPLLAIKQWGLKISLWIEMGNVGTIGGLSHGKKESHLTKEERDILILGSPTPKWETVY